jgi:hypothetical protein
LGVAGTLGLTEESAAVVLLAGLIKGLSTRGALIFIHVALSGTVFTVDKIIEKICGWIALC